MGIDGNPYHQLHLEGHDHPVRALAARGRTLVSGSYDCTVLVWDIVTGECKFVLVGHTQKGKLHRVSPSDLCVYGISSVQCRVGPQP